MKKNSFLALIVLLIIFTTLNCQADDDDVVESTIQAESQANSRNTYEKKFSDKVSGSEAEKFRMNSTVQTIKNNISNLQKIVNDKNKSRSEKTSEIEIIMKQTMDYDSFFKKIMPRNNKGENIWETFSEEERIKIIDEYNREYVKTYFSALTDCTPLKIKFLDNVTSGKTYDTIKGSYTCSQSNDPKKFDILKQKSSSQISNIILGSISFLAQQKKDFENETTESIRNKINNSDKTSNRAAKNLRKNTN